MDGRTLARRKSGAQGRVAGDGETPAGTRTDLCLGPAACGDRPARGLRLARGCKRRSAAMVWPSTCEIERRSPRHGRNQQCLRPGGAEKSGLGEGNAISRSQQQCRIGRDSRMALRTKIRLSSAHGIRRSTVDPLSSHPREVVLTSVRESSPAEPCVLADERFGDCYRLLWVVRRQRGSCDRGHGRGDAAGPDLRCCAWIE